MEGLAPSKLPSSKALRLCQYSGAHKSSTVEVLMLEMAWYIAFQDYHTPLSQHVVACYVTKFESQSFINQLFQFWGSLGSARKLRLL